MALKYKVGDRVRVKSLDWYKKSINNKGVIICGSESFTHPMSYFCNKIVSIITIQDDCYRILEDDGDWYWTDEMIEGLVEEEVDLIPKFGEYSDNEPLDIPTMTTDFVKKHGLPCPDGYIFKDENGNIINATKIVLEKKKKEYPKTYEECCKVLGCKADYFFTDFSHKGCDVEISDYENKVDDLLQIFRKLRYCRDAYWQIAGEEMGLDGPWEPDWESETELKYTIVVDANKVCEGQTIQVNTILAFPTEEMRDAFKENFDPDIEICKELL